MRNPFKLILLSLACFLGATVQAQISYESSDYASSGDSYFISELNQIGDLDALDLIGADVSWDFSELTLDSQSENEVKDPTLSIYATTYIAQCVAEGGNIFLCTAEWATLSSMAISTEMDLNIPTVEVTDASLFYDKSSSKLEATLVGLTVDAPGVDVPLPLIISYEPKDVVFEFPLEYGDNFTSSSAFQIDLEALLTLPLNYTQTQERTTSVDGWGSISTPYQTFNDVIKVTSVLEIEASAGIIPVNRTERYYSWFAKEHPIPVFEVMQIEVGGVVTNSRIRYLDEEQNNIGVDELNNDWAVYPNPSNGVFVVQSSQNKQQYTANLYDLLGNKMMQWESNDPIEEIDVQSQGFSKGIYLLSLVDASGFQKTIRLIYK